MPYPNEHSARVRDPDDFQQDSFRRKQLPQSEGGKGGVSMILGRLHGESTMTVQAYRFPKDKYTVKQAKQWLKDYNVDYIDFEPAEGSKNKESILIKDLSSNVFQTQIKDFDEKKGQVKIVVNAFNNEDTDGDISVPGSFQKTIKENRHRLRHFLNHNLNYLIGAPKEINETSEGLVPISQLNLNKEIGRDTFEDYKLYAEMGMTLEHSIAVEAMKRDEENQRYVKEWRLWEYSTLTGWGANENTPLQEMKTKQEIQQMINFMLQKGNYSDNRFTLLESIYKALKTEPSQNTQLKDEPLVKELQKTVELLNS